MYTAGLQHKTNEDPKDQEAFRELYTRVREKESRLYTDKEVAGLPDISAAHPHFKEWLIRKRSCKKLTDHLKTRLAPLKILEVGCGNGWLSFQLSRIASSEVTATDINLLELEQARRVFGGRENLQFIPGDIRSGILRNGTWDVIVFAASIQYFDRLEEVLKLALRHLTPEGEIHIIDTRFYRQEEVAAARLRTISYYTALSFPEMGGYYFHHCLSSLHTFHYRILHHPFSIRNKLLRNRNNPFYWILVKHQ